MSQPSSTISLLQAVKPAVGSLIESVIKWLTARRGVRRVVNKSEFRVDSCCRHQFAPSYEARTAEFLRKRIDPGVIIYNVGANVGVLALQLARWAGPTGRVFAFEPNPHALRLLRRNVLLNGMTSQVEVIGVAIGEASGQVDLHVVGANGMARAARANPLLPNTEQVQVPVTTLDAFSDRHQVVPDWIVMDIEGWEVAALRGARTILTSKHKQIEIVAELHPRAWAWSGHTRADLERILAELGRSTVAIDQQQDPLAENGHVYFQRHN